MFQSLRGTKSQDSVHRPLLKRKESRSGFEPRSPCLPALTAGPNQLTHRAYGLGWWIYTGVLLLLFVLFRNYFNTHADNERVKGWGGILCIKSENSQFVSEPLFEVFLAKGGATTDILCLWVRLPEQTAATSAKRVEQQSAHLLSFGTLLHKTMPA